RLALVLAVQLTTAPPVLLLDEPTRGLDYHAKERFTRVVRECADEGRSVVVATHDVEFVARTADRVVVMAQGEIVADGATGEVVVSSPVFAPQVAKVLGPRAWLTVEQVHRVSAVRVGSRTVVVLALASVAGVAMFFWPLFAAPEPEAMAHSADAPLIFVVAMPILLAVVAAEMTSGGMDPKALALLGVLAALNAGLRPLGAGLMGIETVFFLVVLAGRVFGPGFGFLLGGIALFASALLTAGVGPWLPFQMICSAWIGLGAGLLPGRVTGRAEIWMLVAYGIFVAYAFGFLMNMWFWPFTAGVD